VETEIPHDAKKPPSWSEHHLGKVVLALLAMVAVMVWSFYDKGPSGQTLGIKGFVLFWLRELVVLAFVVIALIIAGLGWLRRRIKQIREGNHAP
jgi:hypothetical protein